MSMNVNERIAWHSPWVIKILCGPAKLSNFIFHSYL